MAKRRRSFLLQAEVLVPRVPMVWSEGGVYTVPESPFYLSVRRVQDRVVAPGMSMSCDDAISYAYALLGAAGAQVSVSPIPRRKPKADA